MPSHFLNQCWNIVNWTLRNKLQWNCLLQWLINLVGGQLCDMAYIVPMHVKPKFTYLLQWNLYRNSKIFIQENAFEMMHKAWCSIEEVPYYFSRSSIKFQGHMGWKIDDLDQIWARLLGRSQLSNPSDLPCFFKTNFDPECVQNKKKYKIFFKQRVFCPYIGCWWTGALAQRHQQPQCCQQPIMSQGLSTGQGSIFATSELKDHKGDILIIAYRWLYAKDT